MKKLFAGLVAALFLSTAVTTAVTPSDAHAGDDDVAAIFLSVMWSGAGEWYNSGFQGGFPLVECIVGKICICVAYASVIDAAAGKTDDGLRFDFWSSPN